jgi:hypothetical protein
MKNQNRLWAAAVLVLLVCVPAYAQRRARPRADAAAQAKAAQEAREREQRRRDEEEVRRMPDSGSDLAFVVALKASMREEPNASSRVLREMERGEALALMEREPSGTWYKVIHVDSAVEGWVDEKSVVIKLAGNRYNAPPFDEESTEAGRKPELSISNLEPATALNLRINGKLYVIPANSTKNFSFEPGRYEYYGWSPGVRPAIGGDDLRTGMKYSWTFQIVRK